MDPSAVKPSTEMDFPEIIKKLNWISQYAIRLSETLRVPAAAGLIKQLSRSTGVWDVSENPEGWVEFFPGRSVSFLTGLKAHPIPWGCALYVMDSPARKYYQLFYLVLNIESILREIDSCLKNEDTFYPEDVDELTYFIEREWMGFPYCRDMMECFEAVSALCAMLTDSKFMKSPGLGRIENLRAFCASILAESGKPWNS